MKADTVRNRDYWDIDVSDKRYWEGKKNDSNDITKTIINWQIITEKNRFESLFVSYTIGC